MSSYERIQRIVPELVNLRRDLHAHPETRFEEHRTSSIIAERLERLGLAVDRGLAGTGVVGTLKGERPGRAIMLRADMDALPIQEQTRLEYASQNPGCMHACGHDGHVTMLLGAAEILSQEPRLPGDVHFVFQPGEEGGAGARIMIEEGLFDRFPVDGVFGLHTWPSLPAGHFGIRPGPIMAAGARFRLVVRGLGSHAAQPHLGGDTVVAACSIVSEWQTIVARKIDPVRSAVLSTCMIHGGETDNALPQQVELRGTIRALETDVLAELESLMCRVARGISEAHGVEADIVFFQRYPATINSEDETCLSVATMAELIGIAKTHNHVDSNMTSEDFGFMLSSKKGAFALLGSGRHDLRSPSLHAPDFDFNDAVIGTGVAYWCLLTDKWFSSR